MPLVDYTIFYKQKYTDISKFAAENHWEVFISAFNDSQRVQSLFEKVNADSKFWLILPDYAYTPLEYPQGGNVFAEPTSSTEDAFITTFISKIQVQWNKVQLCIDTTGFMRPHLIFLIRYLHGLGVRKFEAIYTDPTTYSKKEDTSFTLDSVEHIHEIEGCRGIHSTDTSNDLLIIASGYDHKLIASVAQRKEEAKTIQIFGLPSLQPDMYQENLLRARKAEEYIGTRNYQEQTIDYFAPAYDPFVTAQTIQQIVNTENRIRKISNLYLCPLSTKAQTLGFILYYLWECINEPVSIIFPYCSRYSRETSKGLAKIWKFTIELPA